MGHTLLAGPFVGEFGYEVICWVPYLRATSRRYKKVIVGTRKGNDYLYADFATKIYHVKADSFTDRWMNHGRTPSPPRKVWKGCLKAQVVMPSKQTCTSRHREFKPYGQNTQYQNGVYDVIIHARAAKKYNSSNRNWPPEAYEEVVRRFRKLTFASVGTEAYHIEGTVDKRGVKLVDLCSMMRMAKVVIGPSSGVMHLAHLCKTPILVWTGKERQKCIKANNRKRYEKLWRAFDTPVKVVDRWGWRPPVDRVVDALKEMV